MKKVLLFFLALFGWLLIFAALLLAAFGIYFGVTENRAFYERQDAYQALAPQRDSLWNVLDSMQTLHDQLITTDSAAAGRIAVQMDSIRSTDSYDRLIGQPVPPMGFSLAGFVTALCILVALVPLVLGIVLVVIYYRRRKRLTSV